MTRKSGIASIAGICALMPATPLAAQVTAGTLLCTVQQNTGAVVNGAKISITGTSKGISQTAVTDQTGACGAPFLVPGTYSVSVEMAAPFRQRRTRRSHRRAGHP